MAKRTQSAAPEAEQTAPIGDGMATAGSNPGPSPRDPDEPTLAERAHAMVASYERGMETNSPRTMAELNELRALLLG